MTQRYFLLRKKGTDLHNNIFPRKSILSHLYQFLKYAKHRGQKSEEYEVVELELVVKNTFALDTIKDTVDK